MNTVALFLGVFGLVGAVAVGMLADVQPRTEMGLKAPVQDDNPKSGWQTARFEVNDHDLALDIHVPRNQTVEMEFTRSGYEGTSAEGFGAVAVYDLVNGTGIANFRAWSQLTETRSVVLSGGPGPALAGPGIEYVDTSGLPAQGVSTYDPLTVTWTLEPGSHRIMLGSERARFDFEVRLAGLDQDLAQGIVDLGPNAFRMLSTQIPGDWDHVQQTSVGPLGFVTAETVIETKHDMGAVELVSMNQRGLISIAMDGQPRCSSQGGAVVGIHSLFLMNAHAGFHTLNADGAPAIVNSVREPQAVAIIVDVPGVRPGERVCY